MKTTVINLEGIESVLSPAGVEKRLCEYSGIHKVETNFMTGTATVYHDESVTLADIKRYVAECGYGCSGECLPAHVCKPGDPPAQPHRPRVAAPNPAKPRAAGRATGIRGQPRTDARCEHALDLARRHPYDQHAAQQPAPR